MGSEEGVSGRGRGEWVWQEGKGQVGVDGGVGSDQYPPEWYSLCVVGCRSCSDCGKVERHCCEAGVLCRV